MFLNANELTSAAYQYQLDQITEGDNTIIETGIATAIEEVRGYLTPNFKQKYNDGRLIYDTEAIFSATGTDRNALILQLTKTVAIWHIIQLCNADIMYEQAKERYDRAIKTLKSLADGEITISSLPTIDPEEEGSVANKQPFRFGSREKFNYE
jgi:hypothetical protein